MQQYSCLNGIIDNGLFQDYIYSKVVKREGNKPSLTLNNKELAIF